MSKLADIKQFGQKIWLDNLSRELLNSGKLDKLILDDGIAGVTSNPTIFHKAISNDSSYQSHLAKLKSTNLSHEERYEALVIPDIQLACDLMRELYISSNHTDGYVSFEVSPLLANDIKGTISNAKRLWSKIDRPNAMIKIPATPAGIKAFQELTTLGINVNITLIFSLEQVLNVWEAYINGLNNRLNKDLSVKNIKAVASFFLSRIDTAVDTKLPIPLKGKAAINLCKEAYRAYKDIFNGEVFSHLKTAGATPQFLLFASTGTKNPEYSDVMYVEDLIAPDTINTVPDNTLNAFRDHGNAALSLTNNMDNAHNIIEEINRYVNLAEVGEQLQTDGLKLFDVSFNDLIELMK
jgi:transaldolase